MNFLTGVEYNLPCAGLAKSLYVYIYNSHLKVMLFEHEKWCIIPLKEGVDIRISEQRQI